MLVLKYGQTGREERVIFKFVPPILHLQLKRFGYNFQTDRMEKINDRYEFPLTLNLTKFGEAKQGSKPKRKYVLHSILIHSGDVFGGHYYCFVRLPPKTRVPMESPNSKMNDEEHGTDGDETDSEFSDDESAPQKTIVIFMAGGGINLMTRL